MAVKLSTNERSYNEFGYRPKWGEHGFFIVMCQIVNDEQMIDMHI